MSERDVVIAARGLEKRFGKSQAVRGLDLTVRRGEVYGFLGLNGAGKTTTLKMLLGLIRPDAGEVELFGSKMRPGHAWPFSRIGAALETPGMYENVTVRGNLEVFRRLFGLPTESTDEALALMDLEQFADVAARDLSMGNRRRLSIATAMLHQPELLVLDEPTNALDPAGIRQLRSLVQRLSDSRGVTVLLSSHILAEVQKVATHIGIIHEGVIIDEMDQATLRQRSRTYLELRVSDPSRAAWVLEEKFGMEDFAVHEQGAVRLYERLEQAGAINAELVSAGVMVSSMHVKDTGLEDHFIKLVGGDVA